MQAGPDTEESTGNQRDGENKTIRKAERSTKSF